MKTNLSTLDRRGTIHVYIRSEDRELFKKFVKLLEHDSRLENLKKGDRVGLVSIAILQLVIKYVDSAENGEIPGITATTIREVNRVVDRGKGGTIENGKNKNNTEQASEVE